MRQQIGPRRAALNTFQDIRLRASLSVTLRSARCARSYLLLSAYLETKPGVASTQRNARLIRTKPMCSLASLDKQVSAGCIF